MRHSHALKLTFVLGVIVAGMAPAPADAVPMSFDLVGVDDPNLSAHVVFTQDAVSQTVSIQITNTSSLAAGPDPRFTAFAFNAPAGVTGISFSGPSGWEGSYVPNGINTPGQFGLFDIAGITGPNFNGGSPNVGIPRGSMLEFTYSLTFGPAPASLLNVSSFDPPGANTQDPQYFIGRFQRTGLNMQGSDVATPSNPPVPIPEPVSLVLFGSGLTGLWWMRRRRS